MTKSKLYFSIITLGLSATVTAQTDILDTDTLQNVIVTGTNNATKSSLIPYSVTSISQEQIEATGRTQLLSALSGRIPSLFITERNIFGFGLSTGGSGSIKLRGIGGSPTSQLLMLVDGKPQFAGVFSHPVADLYESEYVDHVEVLRGPASVLYGSNAMGGAINVITKNQKKDGVYNNASLQFGSFNTWQASVTNMIRFGKFSSVLSINYDQTDGTQKDFDFRQGGGYVKVGYDISANWNIYADYSLMKFIGNDPVYARISNPESTDIYHQDVLRGEASLVANNIYKKTNGSIRLYYSHGNHKIQDPKDFQMLDNRVGVLLYQNYQPWKLTNFTLGFDFNRYSGEVPLSGGLTREEALKKKIPTTMAVQSITEFAPYLTASQGVWKNLLVINAGIRVANSAKFGTHVLPQGGITVNPGKQWTVKASVSKGYRNPSFKELYLYKMANDSLQPEEMMNYEVSVGKSFSHWLSLELTGYIAKGSNLIITTIDMKNVNSGSFNNKGVEFTATSRPFSKLNLRASYSYLHSDLELQYRNGAPTHQYYFGADWHVIPKLLINADLTGAAGLSVVYQDSKTKKYILDSTQNYALLNLKVTYKVKPYIDLFIQGNNITNTHYCINKGYQMPGITATGGFKVRF